MSDRLESGFSILARPLPVHPERAKRVERVPPHRSSSTPAWKKNSGKVGAEINVTPLVDVVLVLLIIFMVVTAAVEPGKDVELPKIGQPDAAAAKFEPVTVSVEKDGQLWLEKDRVDEAALRTALRETHTQSPERKVVLKADRSVGYGKVRSLFKECRDVGFPGVSLQVLERSTGT
jgi:biopolymer transport protein TolR